jgi:trehalose/maltose hydrolase-like predicted phosphorylase
MNLKGVKITDPVVLERLRLAREKALIVRQTKAADRKDKKLVVEIEAKQEKASVQSKLAKLNVLEKENEVVEPVAVVKKTKSKKTEVEPVVEPESESEPEPEPVIVVKKSKPKAVKKKKVVYVEESSSSSEEEVVVKRKKKVAEPRSTTPPSPVPVKADPVGDLYHKIYG